MLLFSLLLFAHLSFTYVRTYVRTYVHTNLILVPKRLFREYKKEEKKKLNDNIFESKIMVIGYLMVMFRSFLLKF